MLEAGLRLITSPETSIVVLYLVFHSMLILKRMLVKELELERLLLEQNSFVISFVKN